MAVALPARAGAGTAPGFGVLDLVRSNAAHLDVPAVEGAETYFASLANPARDLAAMKVCLPSGGRLWRS